MLAAVLRALAIGAMLVIAVLFVLDALSGELALPPLRALVGLLGFAYLPYFVERAVRLLLTATLEVGAQALRLTDRWEVVDIPRDALAMATPWTVSLPVPGLTLQTRAGRRFDLGVPLRARDLHEALGVIARSSVITYALARSEGRRHPRARFVAAFVVFPLLPALLVFRAHQVITYGSWIGQYQQYGLGAYAGTFARYLLETLAQLVLYAALWRALVEPVLLALTALLPARAAGVRRGGEVFLMVAYFVGVPALIAWLFLA